MLTTDGGRGLPWRWPVTKGTVMSVETAGDWTWVRVLSGSICQDDVEEVTCRRTHGELCHFTTQFYSTLYRVFFVSSFPAHKCDSRQPCFSSTGQLFPAKTENLCLTATKSPSPFITKELSQAVYILHFYASVSAIDGAADTTFSGCHSVPAVLSHLRQFQTTFGKGRRTFQIEKVQRGFHPRNRSVRPVWNEVSTVIS